MDDLLKEFQSLLNQTSGKGLAGSIELLLLQMESDNAEELRLCALPHQFDVTVLQALAPGLDEAQGKSIYEEFSGLSIVLSLGNESALHDEARRYLFDQWLAPDRATKLREASERLVQHYEKHAAAAEGVALENLERNRMFHLFGVDKAEGFADFERLLDEMGHQYRLNECETLINLVHEYDSVLSSEYALCLTYYEGKLAADLRQWTRAEKLLDQVSSSEEVSPGLQMKAYYRLGIVHADQRKWEEAVEIFRNALELAESQEENGEFVYKIMHDLGCVYRDSGELREAEKYLKESIQLAEEQDDFAAMALAYNSLGNLHRKLGNVHEAVKMYENSLNALEQDEDRFRPAQVYNNLGMAYADLGEWQKSEEVLQRSLEIKRQAGDTRGQGLALSNLLRVYWNLELPQRAIEVSHQAMGLLGQVNDHYSIALVRRNLGKLYLSMKNLELSKEFFSDAIELFKALGEDEDAQATQIELDDVIKRPVTPTVPSYFVHAILVAFLCLPFAFGIVAIVSSAQVKRKLRAGDYDGAAKASTKARKWCWIAFGVGLPTDIVCIALLEILL